jgi:hypothetical protein
LASEQDSRNHVEQDEPPRRLVAIVKALGAQSEADPDQWNVEDDEKCDRQAGSGEIAPREHDDGQDDQKYDHDADGDVGQPVGFPVQAALK